jgi:hypothetical protein
MEPAPSPLAAFARREPRLGKIFEELNAGTLYPFSAWPVQEVPSSAGVYSIWRGEEFLYVGAASGPGYRAGQPPAPSSDIKGLRAQLRGHWLGLRSGDPFCIYVCDRMVLPQLKGHDRAALSAGGKSLDELTKNFIQANLSFRFAPAINSAEALRVQRLLLRHGLPGRGRPVLNPTTTVEER